MERAVYCVSLKRGEWTIRLNNKHFGPCPSRDMAVQVAVSAATKAFARGYQAHVLAQDGDKFRTVWFNGKSPSTERAIASVAPEAGPLDVASSAEVRGAAVVVQRFSTGA